MAGELLALGRRIIGEHDKHIGCTQFGLEKPAAMKINLTQAADARRARLAFTLFEVCISVAILAVMLVSLYGGMSSSFSLIQSSRENLRATQIMLERVEGLRLFNWNQLVYSNMIPTTFTAYYFPLAAQGESKGCTYVGTVEISAPVMNPPATYSATCAPST